MAAPVLSRGTTFALIAFGVSWATWLPLIWWTPAAWLRQLLLIGGTFGPSIAAVVLLRMGESHAALGAELKRHWRWRLPVGWWLFILGGPAVLILVAMAITHFLGVPAGEWNDAANLYLVVPVLAYVTVLGGPLGEELGWRGYAFARLQRRFRPVTAALAVGVVWGLWHVPLFAISGTVQQQIPMPAFGGQILATAVIYGWLWNRTASLPAVIAIHAAANTATGLVPVLPTAAGSTAPMWMTVALAVGVAAVLIVATGGDLGAERHSISAGHSARS